MTDKLTRQEIRFSFSQLFNPTPEIVRKGFKIFFSITTVVAMRLNYFTSIPPDVKTTINDIVVQSNGFAFAVIRFFGIDVNK